MQVRERVSSLENKISLPPVFDFNLAQEAREKTEKLGLENFHALRIALTLSLYNHFVLDVNPSDSKTERLYRSFQFLIQEEQQASQASNPLPTIGFEVESPQKVNDLYDGKTYGYFFDLIGMPRNRLNSNQGDDSSKYSRWEFSPPPSYSSNTQERILCELIKGNFIPHLNFSQKPREIIELLDEKLISLHINLGIPDTALKTFVIKNENTRILMAAFALVFSSPERLERKSTDAIGQVKDAEQTLKNCSKYKRLEIKSFEVLTENTYRLMYQVQSLATVLFAYFNDDNPLLKTIWKDCRKELKLLFNESGFNLEQMDNKMYMATFARSFKDISKLRSVLTSRSIQIRNIINSRD